MYAGRYASAAEVLRRGAATAAKAADRDRAAWNYSALARAELARGRLSDAARAVEGALANSQSVKVRFLSALTLAESKEFTKAAQLASGLASELQAEPQSYGKIVEGQIALQRGDARGAAKQFADAIALLDTWIGHFSLGRANLEAGAYVQADAEFDRCIARRGEAVSLFLDEEPTISFLPPVHFYQGRARDGMRAVGAAESYRTYLSIRGNSNEDNLAAQAQSLLKP
jgi:hypothetical protein